MIAAERALYREIGKYKLLSREQEVELAKKIEAGDMKARDRMVMSNMRLAIKIASDFHKKSGSNFEDLRSAAVCGLIKAVDRFDHTRGFKFSTYARWWIMQALRQQIVQDIGIAKLPSSTPKKLYEINQFKIEYRDEFGVNPTLEEVAAKLGVSTDAAEGIIRCSKAPAAFHRSYSSATDMLPLHELLPENNPINPLELIDEKKMLNVIYQTLEQLTKREEAVLRLRLGLDADFSDTEKYAPENLTLENEE